MTMHKISTESVSGLWFYALRAVVTTRLIFQGAEIIIRLIKRSDQRHTIENLKYYDRDTSYGDATVDEDVW